MPRNTTVNLVSEKGRKLTAEEHDETIGNLKQTADEAHDLASAALPANGTAADSALLQGKGIGTNPGNVMAVGAFGVGNSSAMGQTTGFKEVTTMNGAIAFKSSGNRTFFLYALGGTGELRLDTYQETSILFGSRIIIDNQTAQSMLNKKISFQNANDSGATVLDWYEEGTFTPELYGMTTSGTGIYTVREGSYQRIGNRVHFQLRIVFSAHSGTGDMRISGLPFAPANLFSSPCVVLAQNLATDGDLVAAVGSTTPVIILYVQSSAAWNEVQMCSAAEIRVSGSYRV